MARPPMAFTKAQLEHIHDRYAAGASVRSIGMELGCTAKPVIRVLTQRGVYEPGYRDRFTDEQKSEMVTRYETGETLAELGAAFGSSQMPIRTILRDRNATIRPARRRGEVTAETLSLVRERREQGRTSREIARELGVATTDVLRWLKRLGLPGRGDQLGPNSSGWVGGRTKAPGGYVGVWVHPDDPMHVMAWRNHYVMEHRLVMARSLDRPLTSSETVHHLNGDKLDNRLENLQLRQGFHGKGVRQVCLDCGSSNVGPAQL